MFEPPVQRLIDELSRLPGIGRKSAQRLAFHILNTERADAENLAEAIVDMREQVRLCIRCYNVTAEEQCSICVDPRRDPSVICVVERAQDIPVIERTQEFKGRYHVLGGTLSAIDGRGPAQLRVDSLLARAGEPAVTEVILALSATVEGQTTAHYLSERLADKGVTVSRLAHGVPVGGELDYLDDGTLTAALKARRPL